MATYNQFIVTDSGRALLAKAVANKETFTISSIKTSSHVYQTADIPGLTELIDVAQSFPVSMATTVDETTAKLQFNITNVGLSMSYTLATIGVYATYRGLDTLFAVSTANNPDVMNVVQQGALIRNILVTIYVKTANASNISISVAMDSYVSKEMLDQAIKKALNLAHPVGSVYLQISGDDPATAFGGCWKKIEGTYLIASGSYAGQTLTAGERIGEAQHLITLKEMPNHDHKGRTDVAGSHKHGTWGERSSEGGSPFGLYNANNNHAGSNGGIDYDNTLFNTSTDGEHAHNFTTGKTGGSDPMLIMPLATVVDAWVRQS